MEKAVLKTLIYADIFDYPLKAWETHKWLISKKASLQKVEKALKKLIKEAKIKNHGDYYFLSERKGLVAKRLNREKVSRGFFKKVKRVANLLKIIPWIRLIGVSGSLALNNAKDTDDIDLFIITEKNRLWVTRLATLAILNTLNVRRKRGQQVVGGKICTNILIEEDKLAQQKDLYLAHEVLQMRVLWQRNLVYQDFLDKNSWAFKYLPNWATNEFLVLKSKNRSIKKKRWVNPLIDDLETLSKRLQMQLMGKPQGLERIREGEVYFHPQDKHIPIMQTFKQKLAAKLDT